MAEFTVAYVNEAGEVMATDRYTMSPDDFVSALRLPTSPRRFACLGCDAVFVDHPGGAQCRACGNLYCGEISDD